MKTKKFGLTETKLFHLHGVLKNGRGVGPGRGFPSPLDPILFWLELASFLLPTGLLGILSFVF